MDNTDPFANQESALARRDDRDMNQYRPQRILVPLDGSELATNSIPYARVFADVGAELVLCRVVSDPIPLMELAGSSAYPRERIIKSKLAEAGEYLDAVATVLRDKHLRVTAVCTVGEPPDALLETAIDQSVDLIVMASHGRGFLGRILVGSVADRIARAASVPVMLVHPDAEGAAPVDAVATIGRLVVPLDGSDRARQALPVATVIARRAGATIHLIRVLPPREDVMTHGAPSGAADYAEYTYSVDQALRSEASRLTDADLQVTSEVAIGAPAQTIVEVLGEDDVVVMSSHGQGGVRRWLLGSVAERLIHAGKTPVVLVPVAERERLTRELS